MESTNEAALANLIINFLSGNRERVLDVQINEPLGSNEDRMISDLLLISLEQRSIFDLIQPNDELQKSIADLVKPLSTVIKQQIGNNPMYFREWEFQNKQALSRKTHARNLDYLDGDVPEKDHLAYAASCYLLRAHALFYGRPYEFRLFNSAKTSLNDMYQAYQLTCRLYYGLPRRATYDRNLEDFLADVAEDNGRDSISPRFVWTLLLLNDILRGEIYRRINHAPAADRHFRRAHHRFQRQEEFVQRNSKFSNNSLDALLSPRYLLALLERSELHYDSGHYIESLHLQLRCLKYINSTDVDIKDICNYLDSIESGACISRKELARQFGFDVKSSKQIKLNLPEKVNQNVAPGRRRFASEVLARIGFTLYTLRPLCKNKNKDEVEQWQGWLLPYFIPKEYGLDRLKTTELGRYCALFLGHTERVDYNSQHSWLCHEQLERQYVYELRRLFQLVPESPDPQARLTPNSGNESHNIAISKKEWEFYQNILTATTKNIRNMITQPRVIQSYLMRRGYIFRKTEGDLSKGTVEEGFQATLNWFRNSKQKNTKEWEKAKEKKRLALNKLVVLRRWQSYNPKIPRPGGGWVRGGGYYLVWHGKGIVIDPGYDFIQNFYDEGFSLEDIHAVIISHSHPDHDDDFSSLMTLIKEWNEYHSVTGNIGTRKGRLLDLFLNESTHKKFSSWLQASKVNYGRIIPLPLVQLDKNSEEYKDGPFRGKNCILDLTGPDGYDMRLEVVPAWHDDVIGHTSAVGMKFHLLGRNKKNTTCILGYTGDTGAYGLPMHCGGKTIDPTGNQLTTIVDHYKECDILIAHLGDVRLRELLYLYSQYTGYERQEDNLVTRLFNLGDNSDRMHHSQIKGRIREFLDFGMALQLFSGDDLKQELCKNVNNEPVLAISYLQTYYDLFDSQDMPQELKELLDTLPTPNLVARGQGNTEGLPNSVKSLLAQDRDAEKNKILATQLALFAMKKLSQTSHKPWRYEYHIGIYGLYRLFLGLCDHARNQQQSSTKLLIVGELPEELSYRDQVAAMLNKFADDSSAKANIHAMTGDIGLHIGLTAASLDDTQTGPKVRCTFCNYNNELVLEGSHYHQPHKIREIPLRRRQSAMIYLCEHHAPDPATEYLIRPEDEVRMIAS